MPQAINGLEVIAGIRIPLTGQVIPPSPPNGFTLIDQDLNAGAGGTPLFLAYRKFDTSAESGSRIGRVDVIAGDTSNIQHPTIGNRIDVDLNRGAGGKFIYIVYELLAGHQQPFDNPCTRDLAVVSGGNAAIQPPPGFTKIGVDLNQGAGGRFIYLCYVFQ